MKITIENINDAAKTINKQIIKTPTTYSSTLSQRVNCEVYLKLENLQLTGAYKVRGAINRLTKLSEEKKKAGVIAASAGNHAQGVALAAKKLGIKAVIVMPETTPLSKIQGTKKFGAEIILHGNFYDEAYEKALEVQKERNLEFIHPFNDPDIMAGQGTIGLEMLEEVPDLDIVVVPIGGGGLISGIATALKAKNQNIKIIGVEATQMPAMKRSVEAGEIVTIDKKKTIADGIAVTTVKENTFEVVKSLVDEIVTVSEAEISHAIMMLLEVEKVLAEGAGACAFAALNSGKIENIAGKKVGLIVSGGNLDLNFLSKIIERGLSEDGRLCNFKVKVPDAPGTIAKISEVIGRFGANIIEIYHNRSSSLSTLGETNVNFTIETKGHEHIDKILNAISELDFKVTKEH